MIDLMHEERIRRDAEVLEASWITDPRWAGIERNYSAEDVIRLRGSVLVEHTLVRLGADRLWSLMTRRTT
jgi:isocitrate lyase